MLFSNNPNGTFLEAGCGGDDFPMDKKMRRFRSLCNTYFKHDARSLIRGIDYVWKDGR